MLYSQIKKLENIQALMDIIKSLQTIDRFADKNVVIATAMVRMGLAERKVKEYLKMFILTKQVTETADGMYVNGYTVENAQS